MRISPGDLREGITNPKYVVPVKRPEMAGTYSLTLKAVKLYHTEGELAAKSYLRQSFKRSNWASGANKTKASIAMKSFETYCDWANGDQRVAVMGDSRASITVGEHTVGAACDVVLLNDDGGYEGRICHWGVGNANMTDAQLATVVLPVVLALRDELEDDLVRGVEVWQLRSGWRRFIPTDLSLGQMGTLRRLVRQMTS